MHTLTKQRLLNLIKLILILKQIIPNALNLNGLSSEILDKNSYFKSKL